MYVHFVIEDLGFSRLGLGDQNLVQDIKDIITGIRKFLLNLLTVNTNDADMLFAAL